MHACRREDLGERRAKFDAVAARRSAAAGRGGGSDDDDGAEVYDLEGRGEGAACASFHACGFHACGFLPTCMHVCMRVCEMYDLEGDNTKESPFVISHMRGIRGSAWGPHAHMNLHGAHVHTRISVHTAWHGKWVCHPYTSAIACIQGPAWWVGCGEHR